MLLIRRMALAAFVVTIPTWASAWWAWNRHEVFPVSPTVYEVVGRVGTSAADYWCAAGDFAQRVMGVPSAQRIYIWREIGGSVTRPGRRSVQFSLSPPPDADTSTQLSLSVKRAGDNLARHAAVAYCQQFDDDFFLRRW